MQVSCLTEKDKAKGGDKLHLLVKVKAPKVNSKEKRKALNLGLVLDRSGSMYGDKLKFLKEAAKLIVNQLGNNDRLSIVIYDDQIDVIKDSDDIIDKKEVCNLIDKIEARSMTNLHGGWVEGVKQVKKN